MTSCWYRDLFQLLIDASHDAEDRNDEDAKYAFRLAAEAARQFAKLSE